MTREGIIIGQEGADVNKIPDYQKVLDSKFPMLEIAYEQDVATTYNVTSDFSNFHLVKLLDHNLGFIPAFDWFPSKSFYTDGNDGYEIVADEKSIYVNDVNATGASNSVQGHIVVYNFNLKSTITPTTSSFQPQANVQSKYGIKNLGDGTNIESTNFKDFSLHTKAKALNIHQSGIAIADSSNNYTAQVEHDLGYMPSYISYVLRNRDIGPYGGSVESDFTKITNALAVLVGPQYNAFYCGTYPPLRTYADYKTIRFSGIQAVFIGQLAYIVFKDPIAGSV